MIGSVKVERRHREAACEVTNWDGTTSCTTAFIAGDPSLCTCKGDSYPWRNKVRIAQAIADAEQRGHVEEQARAVRIIERAISEVGRLSGNFGGILDNVLQLVADTSEDRADG